MFRDFVFTALYIMGLMLIFCSLFIIVYGYSCSEYYVSTVDWIISSMMFLVGLLINIIALKRLGLL